MFVVFGIFIGAVQHVSSALHHCSAGAGCAASSSQPACCNHLKPLFSSDETPSNLGPHIAWPGLHMHANWAPAFCCRLHRNDCGCYCSGGCSAEASSMSCLPHHGPDSSGRLRCVHVLVVDVARRVRVRMAAAPMLRTTAVATALQPRTTGPTAQAANRRSRYRVQPKASTACVWPDGAVDSASQLLLVLRPNSAGSWHADSAPCWCQPFHFSVHTHSPPTNRWCSWHSMLLVCSPVLSSGHDHMHGNWHNTTHLPRAKRAPSMLMRACMLACMAAAQGTAAAAFQRVKDDEWLGKKGSWDNSYVGTFGENGWGFRAQQVLGAVRGK